MSGNINIDLALGDIAYTAYGEITYRSAMQGGAVLQHNGRFYPSAFDQEISIDDHTLFIKPNLSGPKKITMHFNDGARVLRATLHCFPPFFSASKELWGLTEEFYLKSKDNDDASREVILTLAENLRRQGDDFVKQKIDDFLKAFKGEKIVRAIIFAKDIALQGRRFNPEPR